MCLIYYHHLATLLLQVYSDQITYLFGRHVPPGTGHLYLTVFIHYEPKL